MKQTKNTAFTLVELIVVITILAVLATVAFISFQGYTSSSRDSVRLADLKNISKSFEFMKTKDQQLPLPDQKIDISNSGTIFQYQGVLEEQTLKLSNIHNGGLDPLDGEPYGYAVNIQRNKFQVIGFLENSQTAGNNLFSQSLADNSDKFLKTSGDEIGILLDPNTKEVIAQSGGITEIDLKNTTDEYRLVFDNAQNQVSGTGTYLGSFYDYASNPIASCLAILKNGNSKGSGMYDIQPDGEALTNVYCDMETQGGGWTRLFVGSGSQMDDTLIKNYSFANKVVSNEVMGYYPPTGDYNIFRSRAYYEFFLSRDDTFEKPIMMDVYSSKRGKYEECEVDDGTGGRTQGVALYCGMKDGTINLIRNYWVDLYYQGYFDYSSDNGFFISNGDQRQTLGYEKKYEIYVR